MRLRLALILACGAAAFAATPASAAVTVGGDPTANVDVQTGCGGSPCTIMQSSDPAGVTFSSPIDGVVVRWRIRTGNGTGAWRMRAVKTTAPTLYTGAGSTAFETVAPGAAREFQARMPIAKDDLIGLDGPPSATSALGSSMGPGGSTKVFNPPLADNAPGLAATGNGGGFRLQYNADIEADGDRDGYGDESQDACPADAAKQRGCVTITEGPKLKLKTKKRKAKVRFVFGSSTPGATFECRIDTAPFAPCASPLQTKVKKGRHTFEVRSTRASGLADPATAVYAWKVKRKKAKKAKKAK